MSKKAKKIDTTGASCRSGRHVSRRANVGRKDGARVADMFADKYEAHWEAKRQRMAESGRVLAAMLAVVPTSSGGKGAAKPNAVAKALEEMRWIYPDAAFGAALADMQRLGLLGDDLPKRMKADGRNAQKDLARRVHDVRQREGCSIEQAKRVVALDVEAVDADAALERVRRAWLAWGKKLRPEDWRPFSGRDAVSRAIVEGR